MVQSLIDAGRDAIRQGRHDAALQAARSVLASAPDHIDALEIVSIAEQARGNMAEAETALRRIIASAPDAGWARDDLARLLLGTGRAADAEQVVRETLAADAAHADAHAMLGVFLSEREALVEGGWHIRRALALAGPHPQLLTNLGRNLMRQGALDEAGELVAQAARLAPDSFEGAILLAEIAEQQGKLDNADEALGRAAILGARQGLDVLLARATLLSRGQRWVEALALLDGLSELSGAARLLRGRLRDRAERYDEAWSDFITGKSALAGQYGRRYDRASVDAHFAALAQAFPAHLPHAKRRDDGPQPIFILGMPRSGTTMTEQLLDSHSAIRAGGELNFTAELTDFAARLLGAPFPACLGLLAAADHHHVPALLRDFYLARAEVYGLTAPGAALFTDKMPVNEIYAPLLRIAFPDAPMVSVRRHPLDILVSIMAHDLTHGFNCGYRIENAAHQLAAVSRLSEIYRERLGLAPHLFAYEGFVADPAGETARLMAYLRLAHEPAQMRFHENRRHAPTPSYAQVREPLHARSIGRWQHYRAQLAPILPIVAEAIERGGYSA